MNSCSVIIPTLNAAGTLEILIARLREQTAKIQEIIVIDSSSTDNTLSIAQRLHCTTICIPQQDFDHGGTRNLAAKQAKSQILVFLTQDALPADQYFLEKLITPIHENVAAATYARQLPQQWDRITEKFAREFNYPPESIIRSSHDIASMGIKTYFFSNVASAIDKQIFFNLGMFSNKIIMNEDMLFCSKLLNNGLRVMYAADAKVYHSHNYSLKQIFQRYFDIGVFFTDNFNLSHLNMKSSGSNYTTCLFLYIIKNKAYTTLPHALCEIISKFFGFYSGKISPRLPHKLNRYLSMHKNYWTNT